MPTRSDAHEADRRKNDPPTPGEVARALCVQRETIAAAIRDGRIKAFKPLGGHWRVSAEELARLTSNGGGTGQASEVVQ